VTWCAPLNSRFSARFALLLSSKPSHHEASSPRRIVMRFLPRQKRLPVSTPEAILDEDFKPQTAVLRHS
jgi:hypothetical protein